MPTEPITLSLPAEVLAALQAAVEAGEYASPEDAVGDALRVWQRRHKDRAEELAWVKARIKASLADPRPSLSGEEVDAHLEAFFANAERQADEAA